MECDEDGIPVNSARTGDKCFEKADTIKIILSYSHPNDSFEFVER
jgi:hypothetical protein